MHVNELPYVDAPYYKHAFSILNQKDLQLASNYSAAFQNLCQIIKDNIPTLIITPYFPEPEWERNLASFPYFPVDWDDPDFRSAARKEIRLRTPFKAMELPSDRTTVALHIRTGGGYAPDIDEANHPLHALKFLPDTYYIEQLRKLDDILNHRPLYIHLFTDHPNPEELAEKYSKALNLPNLQFNYRKVGNKYDANVLEDFFGMLEFDCLVASASNFAFIASILGHYDLVIMPTHRSWETGRVDQVVIKYGKR
jgi:hypothetical protein